MSQSLSASIRRLLSIIAFFSALFVGLVLSGCQSTTGDLVELRGKERNLRLIDNELNDNLQASCHGMNANKSEDARKAFNDIVNVIIGLPSNEEMLFAENASIGDVSRLMDETVEFLNSRDKLRKEISSMKKDHDDSYDDWSIGWVVAGVVSFFVAVIVSIRGLVSLGNYL